MSERVVPTEPGWWWLKYTNHERPVVVNVFRNSGGNLGHWDNRWYPVGQMQWLAPVPSAEAVQAAEPVVRKLLSGLDEHWQATEEGVAAIAAAEQLIAGLTGGGGV